MDRSLLQYDNPPVTETVLGIEFRPLAAWQMPFFGLYWSRIRENYPKTVDQLPLPEESGGPGIMINLGPMPIRCWFIDESDQWLIQVQNSRFISNWRKRSEVEYPSYTLFRERFVNQYSLLQTLLAEEGFPEIHYFQAEVSYINQIDIGSDFGKLSEIFPIFSKIEKGTFLPLPQGGGVNIVYPMPEERGRLFVGIQSILNHETAKEMLQLSVTAKTHIASNTSEAAFEALDYGHEWVVKGFTDFTSAEMHKIWGRTQ